MASSPATRPEDLHITPWYHEGSITDLSLVSELCNESSQPSLNVNENLMQLSVNSDFNSVNNDAIVDNTRNGSTVSRKAYMDLTDAIALLDETCPNSNTSPLFAPATPSTLDQRNKRARSKSSDSSSNYTNDQINHGVKERDKRRPFLRKIGISKTEDRVFLPKFTPKIVGKPYLEKIGPSRAVEKPFLDKIGSSKTLDKFSFDTLRELPQAIIRKTRTIVEPITIEKTNSDVKINDDVCEKKINSNKGPLLKMYSFETEDLDEELTVTIKTHCDSLRRVSLDDVLDENSIHHSPQPPSSPKFESMHFTDDVKLVKCRVTTSDEIVSSGNRCHNESSRASASWNNSPQRPGKQANIIYKTLERNFRSKDTSISNEANILNSVKKQMPICVKTKDSSLQEQFINNAMAVPSKEQSFNQGEFNNTNKTRRHVLSEEIIDDCRQMARKNENENDPRYNIQRRGISTDNLKYSRETVVVCSAPSTSSLGYQSGGDSSFNGQDISRGTYHQALHEKFQLHDVPPASYAAFKWRARAENYKFLAKPIRKSNIYHDKIIMSDSKLENTQQQEQNLEISRSGTGKSVLKKQDKIDNTSDDEADITSSLRQSIKKLTRVPSPETMDLLTELQKVKSLLKTPSEEAGNNWQLDYLETHRLPKKISLSDKEFCLSIDRENSIRHSIPPKIREKSQNIQVKRQDVDDSSLGLGFFEKRCISLDYADDVVYEKPEIRAISLTSAPTPKSDTDVTLNSSDAGVLYDSKSNLSDVFTSPTDDMSISSIQMTMKTADNNKHSPDVDIAIPIDQTESVSPRKRTHIQGRTSDLYEIISPRLTPFRAKRRLGKISVEETVKQASFGIDKADCRTVASQKKTKCFPL